SSNCGSDGRISLPRNDARSSWKSVSRMSAFAASSVCTRIASPRTSSAARGATPSAFERRCIPAGCVAPPSNIPDILSRRALPSGRLAVLGATMELHHGLLEPVLAQSFCRPARWLHRGSHRPGRRSVVHALHQWTPSTRGGRAQDLRLATVAHGAACHGAARHSAGGERQVLAAHPPVDRGSMALATHRALYAH